MNIPIGLCHDLVDGFADRKHVIAHRPLHAAFLCLRSAKVGKPDIDALIHEGLDAADRGVDVEYFRSHHERRDEKNGRTATRLERALLTVVTDCISTLLANDSIRSAIGRAQRPAEQQLERVLNSVDDTLASSRHRTCEELRSKRVDDRVQRRTWAHRLRGELVVWEVVTADIHGLALHLE